MARSSSVHQGFGVDARDFKLFARALRVAQRDLYRDVHAELREIGQLVADEAKSIVSAHSQSVPPTIRVRVSYATVSVIAGGPSAPVGALYEVGNKGKRGGREGQSGMFRHPVFGDRGNWVEQERYPFLAPALRKKLPVVQERAASTLDRVANTVAYAYSTES